MADPLMPQRPLSDRALYLLLAAVVFLGHLLVTGGHLQSPDDELLFRTAESIATRGRLDIKPIEYIEELGQLVVPPDQTFATVHTGSGKFHAQYLPLQAVLAVPLVWIADATRGMAGEAFTQSLGDSEVHPPLDVARSWRRGFVVMVFNPAVMALTAVVLMRLARFLTGGNRRAGLWTAVLWAFGSMAWTHSRTFFTEPLAGLFGLVALDQLLRWAALATDQAGARLRLRHAIGMGLALAAAIWVRMDSPIIAAGMGLTMAGAAELLRRNREYNWTPIRPFPFRDVAVAGVIITLSFVMLVLFNRWRFEQTGSLLGGGYQDQSEGIQFTTPLLVGLHGVLMTPGKGLFFFSPAAILAVWGWFRMPRRIQWAGWMVLGAWFPFCLAMVKWQNWDGGWCWGPRHLFQAHAPLMLGAAFLFHGQSTSLRRIIVPVVLAIGIGVNVFGSSQSSMEFYHQMFRREGYNVLWREFENQWLQSYSITHVDPETGAAIRVPPTQMPAPLVDSLYLPPHTQWNGYAVLWRMGYCDMYFLRLLSGKPPARISLPAADSHG